MKLHETVTVLLSFKICIKWSMLLRQAVNITHILLYLLFNTGIRNTLRF